MRGRAGQARERLFDGGALVHGKLELREHDGGRALQIREEIRIDHRASNELTKSLRHGHRIISDGLIAEK